MFPANRCAFPALESVHQSILIHLTSGLFQGGELIEETLNGNVTEDFTTLDFIKPDGTIITHVVDFKNVSNVDCFLLAIRRVKYFS